MKCLNNTDYPLQSRSSGILLPVFSLPSAHGIGTLGRAAFEFIDFLAEAGQRYWQVLPLNPTGFGDSPYSSCSVFAGNPYFIDLDALADDGLLRKREIKAFDFGDDERRIDYEKLYNSRFKLLRLAFERAELENDADYSRFVSENEWLSDYALYMALKAHFDMKPWQAWNDAGAKLRRPSAFKKYEAKLQHEIEFNKYLQYLFYSQWEKVKAYANSRGIGIIGDLPIYCALDSADCWANRNQFQLDKDGNPALVAGVPPDAFTEDGQLWGNPLYDWERMKKGGYAWWMRRIANSEKLFDAVRIDHFRAIESYWAVPSADDTARNGHWVKGPGIGFINAIKESFPDLPFIAEDLGFLTDEVHTLRRESGWPGMKVLEFAFDPSGKSDYLPHKYDHNCVCYTGTHDNAPLALYLKEASEAEREFIAKYLGIKTKSVKKLAEAILRVGIASTADTFIAQIQDWLELAEGARINMPGTSEGNWQWRMKKGEASEKLAGRIRELTELYGR
ncbi:MAG: 4-alpha-glucanotransferase [Clostridia bacterium]|nr:4-alpha-glucanotransferase [Clostridia bacterium]